MSTITCTTLVLAEDPDERAEAMAVGGFLAGYAGATCTSYATDLRIFATWCRQADLNLLTVKRSHLELFGRWMEETDRMRSTVARRLSTLASFYRYCEQEQLVDRNPALNVRRPKVDYESRTLGLDRNELGAFLVQAGLSSPRDHALSSLLALNGLRISEALGADVEDLDFERGHRSGRRESPSASVLTAFATPSSPLPSTPACPCEMSRKPATPIPGPPCATTEGGVRSIATPPTSWPRSWPAPLAELARSARAIPGGDIARARRLPGASWSLPECSRPAPLRRAPRGKRRAVWGTFAGVEDLWSSGVGGPPNLHGTGGRGPK